MCVCVCLSRIRKRSFIPPDCDVNKIKLNKLVVIECIFYDNMPTRCVANECENTTNANKKTAAQIELEKVMKVTFHSFPSDPVRRAEWIRILKLEDKNINNRSRLCSLHFKEEYIDRTSLVYVRLRENAIPHIFENTLCDEMEDETDMKYGIEKLPVQLIKSHAVTPTGFLNRKLEREDNFKQTSVIPVTPTGFLNRNMERKDNLKQTSVIPVTPTGFLNRKLEKKDNLKQISVIPVTPTWLLKMEGANNLKQTPVIYSKCDKETNTLPPLLQETKNQTQDKETRISPERIWNMNSPSMEMIRKARRTEIENLRKKIKVLQQKVCRKDKKIAIMKTILDELRIENLVND